MGLPCYIWGLVPGADAVCHRMLQEKELTAAETWSRTKAAYELRQAWDLKGMRSSMKDVSRLKTLKINVPERITNV